jgi:copper homeostasis protein
MKTHKLEIACFNYESTLVAQQGGADRIELCDSFSDGGITPTIEIVERTRKKISIDLFIMIRPRGGNFIYSGEEFDLMKRNILQFKQIGVDGFVFGILKKDGSIDKKRNDELIKLAHPFPCSFHRAFDEAANVFQALEDVINCGFKTILTSGQKAAAIDGLETLTELIIHAKNRIVIMPGGGVRSSNISILKEKINTVYFHSSAITGKNNIADLQEVKSLKERLG